MASNVVRFPEFTYYEEEEEAAARIPGLNYSEDDESATISPEEAADSLKPLIEDAVDHIQNDLMPDWELAQKYYNGETDLPLILGRSKATDTPVRDAIRAAKTSILRTFCQANQIVRYSSNNLQYSQLARQQTNYVNRLYWENDGYLALQAAIQDALLKRVGITETYVVEELREQRYRASAVTAEDIMAAQQDEAVSILNIEEIGAFMGVKLFNCDYSVANFTNQVRQRHVPLHTLFVSDAANSEHDARVIGYRESVFVADAIELGLQANWEDFDDEDVEIYANATESRLRRGFTKDSISEQYDIDPLMKRFLLTKCWARFDLEGTGLPQIYCFWLGGTDYQYIAHERVDRVMLNRYLIDPEPSSFFGRSFFDILKENQDVQTSLLRAIIDNAHLANNNRLAVHETLVNMSDVLSPKVGAPIRTRAPGQIQQIGVQPMAAQLLPLVQDLRQQSEVKSGITRASQGLEPEALQSTDKEAVRNTIAQAAGMIEYCARNLAETGVRSTCDNMLRLSIQYHDPRQTMLINGEEETIDLSIVQPWLPLTSNVGLGTANFELKLAMMAKIVATQEMYIEKLGMDNPFTTPDQVYKARAKEAQLMGVDDISEYFNRVPPDVAAQFQQKFEEKLAAQNQGADPTAGLVEAEKIKSQTKMAEMQQEFQLDMQKMQVEWQQKMTELLMNDDLERDKLAAHIEIESKKIVQKAINDRKIQEEQTRNNELNHAAKLDQTAKRAQGQNKGSNSGSKTNK